RHQREYGPDHEALERERKRPSTKEAGNPPARSAGTQRKEKIKSQNRGRQHEREGNDGGDGLFPTRSGSRQPPRDWRSYDEKQNCSHRRQQQRQPYWTPKFGGFAHKLPSRS